MMSYAPPDHAWIQTLAYARYHDGNWILKDPDQAHERLHQGVLGAIPRLYQLVSEAIPIFNLHCSSIKALRVMPWQPNGPLAKDGFIIFSGACQLRLEQETDQSLSESLITLREFQLEPKLLHHYEPLADNFGGLTWMMDKQLTMTTELIMKQLLIDIYVAALEFQRNKEVRK